MAESVGNPGSDSQVVVTAALLVIGDEILSGRTKDKNIGYSRRLSAPPWASTSARCASSRTSRRRSSPRVNALRARYTHVFTTGGIGPTHDDITADSVAKAFGVPIDVDERAVALLLERIPKADLNEARLRMARIPQGASLIANSVSKAPGFSIGNVHVMAGVPAIMTAMLEALAPSLATGRKMLSRSVPAHLKEGDIAAPFGALQARFPDVIMGSYPGFEEGVGFTTTLVLRSRDDARLDEAEAAVKAMLEEVRGRAG